MRSLSVALTLVLTLALGSSALAQPMMMDPSKMSGIPRPDPQVPAGTITVRLIRGQLTNRVVGTEVTLTGPGGEKRQKTDGEGRATFSGLTGEGPSVASAHDGDKDAKSQPISLQPQMGSRVMLVFAAGGLGAPDGVAHPDKALASGVLVVRAEDAAGQGMEGLEVELGHVREGEQGVEEHKAKTDVAGEAKFEGLDHKPTSGYAVRVNLNGAQFASKPFKMEENVGARVVLTIRQTSTDTSSLSLAEGSHLLVEVTDDTLQIIEVFRLNNAGARSFDAGTDSSGGGGLHIPLPRNALQIQTAEVAGTTVVADGHDLVVRGVLPPGDTEIRCGYAIAYHGGTGELVQPTPIPFARVAVVTQQLEGLTVSGPDLHGEDRDMQGRKLTVYFGGGTSRGGELRLSFAGLPHANPTARFVAAGLSVLIAIVFGIYAAGGGGAARSRLERERQSILDRLVQIDAKVATAPDPTLTDEREKLVSRLAEVYRGLDELGGG